jgi:hypothetical protein
VTNKEAPVMPKDLTAAGYRLIDTIPGPGWRWAHGVRNRKITGPYCSVAPTPEAAIEDARTHFERSMPLFRQKVTP